MFQNKTVTNHDDVQQQDHAFFLLLATDMETFFLALHISS
jgi:hypothetical protein